MRFKLILTAALLLGGVAYASSVITDIDPAPAPPQQQAVQPVAAPVDTPTVLAAPTTTTDPAPAPTDPTPAPTPDPTPDPTPAPVVAPVEPPMPQMSKPPIEPSSNQTVRVSY